MQTGSSPTEGLPKCVPWPFWAPIFGYIFLSKTDEPISKVRLSEYIGIDPETLWQNVAGAEKAGLIIHHKATRPKVIKWLELTAWGGDIFRASLAGDCTVVWMTTKGRPKGRIMSDVPDSVKMMELFMYDYQRVHDDYRSVRN